MRRSAERVRRFVTRDLWRIRSDALRPPRSFLVRTVRIAVLSLRGFRADQCGLRASALTFYTLLSMVPIAALSFGIAKGFGFEAILKKDLQERLAAYPEIAEQLNAFAERLLGAARGGVVAGIGLVVLFWTVVRVLTHIERSLNHIWGVLRQRTLAKRFADYFSLLLICPLLLALASSATVFIRTRIDTIAREMHFPLLSVAAFRLLPMVIVWLAFTFVYVFMPNTRVRLASALAGGVVAGTIYQVVQGLYIASQIGATRASAVYGSFAALPLFLVWLQVSWMVVLLGAEISFAHQNVHVYEYEQEVECVSRWFRRLLALRVMHALVRAFEEGRPPASVSDITRELEAPVRLVREVLHELHAAGLASEVNDERVSEPAYQPGRDPAVITVKYVLDALDQCGCDDIPIADSPALRRLRGCLAAFSEAIERSPANVRLKDL